MDYGYLYTLVENDTDTEFIIGFDDCTYTLRSKGSSVIVQFETSVLQETLLPEVHFMTRASVLWRHPIASVDDLYDNVQITIIRDHVPNTYSCRTTPRTARNILRRNVDASIWERVKFHRRMMEDLQRKVRIWHNQCTYLFKKFQEGVERVERLERADAIFQTVADMDLEACYKNHRKVQYLVRPRLNSLSDKCKLYTLLSSMAEGEALLRSCGEISYNRAALALSSPPPSVPTFSKFALATRQLDWIVDFLCYEQSRYGRWKWCEQRCRLVFSNDTTRFKDAMEDDSLEADVRRQNADREALQSFLHQKLITSHGNSSFKFLSPIASWVQGTSKQDELEAVCRKRLQPSSCAPGSYSALDAFIIEDPETSFVDFSVASLGNGGSKNVQKCKWLGETVALSRMSNVPKVSAEAETGFLARVQHPNVVEWMGYAFKEDRDPTCYRAVYLVTEHMESDLHDLINEQLRDSDGTFSTTRPPFRFLVAVDIALQVVEAMIHVHKCRVIHRDLKPENILASPKYSQSSHSEAPIFYTIKLIDFGSSKMGDEDSHFDTRKQGTTRYMAPEVWESEESYSWSADVYSFGLTCYEIFHGRLPFTGDLSREAFESGKKLKFANIQRVMRGKIRFPFAYPEELKELIEKCCAQNPSDRPSFEVIRKTLWRLKKCRKSSLTLPEFLGYLGKP